MNVDVMNIDVIGPAIVLGLGCLGSSMGCGIAGMACHGVMTRVEEGHGKFIALSAVPASQSIYGFLMMIMMRTSIREGALTAASAIGIALSVGLAMMVSSIYQGLCAATAIQATAKQPGVFGKASAAVAIVETFSIFSFVFGLLLLR